MPSQQPGKGIGHFLGAMRIDAFRPAADFKEHMDNWIRGFRACRPMPGEERVLVPGDPEREMQAERKVKGIYLLDAVTNDMDELARMFDLTY